MRVSRLATHVLVLAACFVSGAGGAKAQAVDQTGTQADPQTPPAQGAPTPPGAPGQRPLTPEEQRQKEIDKYDPLKRTEPAKSDAAGASLPAQTPATRPDRNADTRTAPLPGSVAESSQLPVRSGGDEPQVGDEGDSAAAQTYTGPAVLSRSYTISRPTVPKEVKWQWTIGSAEVYQNGLFTQTPAASGTAVTPGTTAAAGTLATNGTAFGTITTFTVNGRHFWKKDQVGLNYNGSYTDYLGANSYNGFNQTLNVDYGHEFSPHLQLNLVETGSILSSNSTLQNPLTAPGVSVANLSLSASPGFQALDQRTRQFQSSSSLTWQKTSRLSFSLGGGFFAVSFAGGPQLSNNVGYQSQADVNYRYTSRTTIGAYYSFTDYTFTKHENVSNTNTVGAIYSYAFNRATQLRLRGGIARVESLGFNLIPIDPVFAVLLGETSGIVDTYRRNYISDLSAQFVRDFGRNKTANVSYARGIAPGNGIILTSIQEVISGTFSATLFRRFNFSVSGGRSTLTSQSQNTGSYTSNYAGLRFSRILPHGATASLAFDYRKYLVTGMPGLQSQLSVTSGVTWGPGPGKIW